ncbi:cbb3-type cytochrome c oxidase subunit I [Dolichospermum sp. LEGE 00240]|jgi:cytochrome c oxidase subunit I|uniref:cytochrome c oxidase subunit I n=1 Tax=Dolichospermum sp. LEGE 00240 TaxID=1828603 RepID=UPI00187FD07F|nr:cbb3-type cytochrome c oxidase subunit I [Dolichospermum sp. LEGE 00240]MBE9251575.1 cbb3-type cytochrome c oxidase subunit I [Dolichospermum sp. LEGE 00240]MDM3848986.1 cbb3-type cytochrome c oxidase subunit I [Aphanizomenon gracile PMC627.10]MDM3857846.1 cbb3-type cytochrome c oxidase subunit I [Aphanizomenon gracile PMC649.10]MDM3861660.1 cbb3-type cytochrome c oxidase subunit I [Aphanizomenon gracile PMC644.10]
MTNIPIPISGESHHQHPPQTWKTYFSFSTDHKVIGIQYLVTSFVFFLVGGIFAMILRGELITPEADLIDRTVYNGMFTMHGTVMLFLWTFPSLVGLANYIVPIMIGARDMAFPRLNAAAFWMVPVVGILMIASFFVPGGPAQSGWWAYPPVSTQNPTGNLITGQVLWLLAVAISGVSSIMGAVNFVTTIVKMRSPGMGFFRMPLMVWAVFSAQIIQLFGLPALTAGAVMLLLDITVGTAFFDPSKGGNPVMFQHYFWFYSHPAVYVIILPIFGVFSEIFPVYSRKPLFGYKVVAVSSMLIAVVSGIVWVHHLYVSGTPAWMRLFFMVTTMFVSIPTGIKVFAWVATIWGGKIRLTTPMLFALGGLVMFVFAGITGIMLSSVPVDVHVNNTYFVVGHFHYVLYGTVTMGMYAAIYHWFPKMTGRMFHEGWGKIHFWLAFIGTNLNFLPMHPLGLQGMLRRAASYAPELIGWNIVASLGSFLLGMSTLPFIFNMLISWMDGEKAPANPWRAIGLEWTISSPPPVENFEEIPIVTCEPYGYGKSELMASSEHE